MKLPSYVANQNIANPDVRVRTNVSPDAFGYQVGQGLESLGYDIARVEARKKAEAAREQAKADDAMLSQAKTSIDGFDSTQLLHYSSLGGKARMDRTVPLEQERKKHLEAVRKGLPARLHADFDAGLAGRNMAFQEATMKGFMKASDDFADATYQNAGKAFVGKVAAHASQVALVTGPGGKSQVLDTKAVDIDKAERIAEIENHYALHGERMADPAGSKALDIAAALNDANVTVLDDARARGDVATMTAFFEDIKGELLPDARETYQAKVTKANEDAAVRRVVGEAALAKVPPKVWQNAPPGVERKTPEEARKDGVAFIKDRTKPGPVQDRALRDFNTAWEQSRKASLRERAGNLEALQARIANGDRDEAILTDERFAQLTPAGRKSVEGQLEQRIKAIDDDAANAAYAALVAEASDPATRGQFAARDPNEWRGALKPAQFGYMKSWHDAVQKGDGPKQANFVSEAQLIDAAVSAAFGEIGDKEKAKAAEFRFRNDLSAMVNAEQATRGKPLSFDDKREFIAKLTAQSIFDRDSSTLGSNDNLSVYQVLTGDPDELDIEANDIPDEEYEAIRSFLIGQNQPRDDAAILDAYKRELRRSLSVND